MQAISQRSGFTLIEVLVAFAILVLALVSIMEIFSTGLQGVERSASYTEAVLLAESKLAAAGISDRLELGERHGRFDERFSWKTMVRPSRHRAGPEDDGNGISAFDIDVTVSWGGRDGAEQGGRSVSLSTTRIAFPE